MYVPASGWMHGSFSVHTVNHDIYTERCMRPIDEFKGSRSDLLARDRDENGTIDHIQDRIHLEWFRFVHIESKYSASDIVSVSYIYNVNIQSYLIRQD